MSEITETLEIVEKSVQVVKAVSLALEKTLPPLKQSLEKGAGQRAPKIKRRNNPVKEVGFQAPKGDGSSPTP